VHTFLLLECNVPQESGFGFIETGAVTVKNGLSMLRGSSNLPQESDFGFIETGAVPVKSGLSMLRGSSNFLSLSIALFLSGINKQNIPC
jgi:hypothetical protein